MVDMSGYIAEGLPPGFNPALADNDTLFELSLKYANGDDVDINYIAAHIFLNIASSRGCPRSAEYRRELAFDMSPEEVAEAQKAARSLIKMMKKSNLN